MNAFLETSVFFGVVVSLLSYGIGVLLKKRFGLGIFNPLLISILITIAFLKLFHIDYDTYNEGAKYLAICSPRQPLPWPFLSMTSFLCLRKIGKPSLQVLLQVCLPAFCVCLRWYFFLD